MSKDDYQVLVYKILLYYYGCLKRKITFDSETFHHSIGKDIDENYLADIFNMMSEEGYLNGVAITKAWGNILILSCDLSDIKITAKGIEYLTENSSMAKVKEVLKSNGGIIGSLISIVLPK